MYVAQNRSCKKTKKYSSCSLFHFTVCLLKVHLRGHAGQSKTSSVVGLSKPLNSPSGRRPRTPPEPLRSCTAPPNTLSPGFLAASPPGSRCSPAATSAGRRWHRPAPQTLKRVREAPVPFGSGSEARSKDVTRVDGPAAAAADARIHTAAQQLLCNMLILR